MRIESNKYYRMRSGGKAFVAARSPFEEKWLGTSKLDAMVWYLGGGYSSKGESILDLIAPWEDEPTVAASVTVRNAEMSKADLFREFGALPHDEPNPQPPLPERMIDPSEGSGWEAINQLIDCVAWLYSFQSKGDK